MSPFDRSRKRLEGVNVRQILEASNLPADLATAIADKCEGLLGPEAGAVSKLQAIALPAIDVAKINRYQLVVPLDAVKEAISEPQSEQPK